VSIRAIHQVITNRRPWWTCSDQVIALLIANHVSESGPNAGTAFPSVRYLGEKSGLSRRRVQEILRRLEADHTIITRESYVDHRQTSNRYDWMLDYGTVLNPLREGADVPSVPTLYDPVGVETG
jgi:DNA-binding transcriptional MocR family regulator